MKTQKTVEIIYGSRSRYNFAYTLGFKNDVTVKHEGSEEIPRKSVEECIERRKELIKNKEIKVKLTPENESNYRRL